MNKQLRGLIFIFISAVFFGSYGVWAKLIGNSTGLFFQVYVRSAMILFILIPLGIFSGNFRKVRKADIKWFAVYSISGALTVAPIFYAFNIIGIGPATLLFYAAFTIGSFVLGKIFFHEKLTGVKIFALLLGITGLFFIFDFTVKQNFLIPSLIAIFAGTAAAFEVVFTKKVSARYSNSQISCTLWAVIFISHFLASFFTGEKQLLPEISVTWFGIVGYALASLCAFSLVVKGYKYIDPAIGSLAGLLEIVVGIVLGIIIFGEILTAQIGLGAILIILAAAFPNLHLFFGRLLIKSQGQNPA